MSQNADLEEDFLPAENEDLFDPAESVISLKDETADLPYEDLFQDGEGCGPKVHEGVAKRIDNAFTKKKNVPKNSSQTFKSLGLTPTYGTTFWTKVKVVLSPFKPSKWA